MAFNTPINPRRPNAQLVAQLLQQNLNVLFVMVEIVKEPGTLVRRLSFDASSNALHPEYELLRVPKFTTLLGANSVHLIAFASQGLGAVVGEPRALARRTANALQDRVGGVLGAAA